MTKIKNPSINNELFEEIKEMTLDFFIYRFTDSLYNDSKTPKMQMAYVVKLIKLLKEYLSEEHLKRHCKELKEREKNHIL